MIIYILGTSEIRQCFKLQDNFPSLKFSLAMNQNRSMSSSATPLKVCNFKCISMSPYTNVSVEGLFSRKSGKSCVVSLLSGLWEV